MVVGHRDEIIGDDLAGLRGPIETDDDRIATLEREIADALQSVQSWQMEVAGRDSDIARLECELSTEKRHYAEVEAELAALTKRAEDAERERDVLKRAMEMLDTRVVRVYECFDECPCDVSDTCDCTTAAIAMARK